MTGDVRRRRPLNPERASVVFGPCETRMLPPRRGTVQLVPPGSLGESVQRARSGASHRRRCRPRRQHQRQWWSSVSCRPAILPARLPCRDSLSLTFAVHATRHKRETGAKVENVRGTPTGYTVFWIPRMTFSPGYRIARTHCVYAPVRVPFETITDHHGSHGVVLHLLFFSSCSSFRAKGASTSSCRQPAEELYISARASW